MSLDKITAHNNNEVDANDDEDDDIQVLEE